MFTLARNSSHAVLAVAAAFAISISAQAEDRLREELARCSKIASSDEKLKCYDALARSSAAAPTSRAAELKPDPPGKSPAQPKDVDPAELANLTEAWKLNVLNLKSDTFRPYRPTYFIGRWTSSVNQQPRSPTHLVAAPQDFDPDELKFQLSFKTEFVSPESFSKLSPGLDRLQIGRASCRERV